MDSFRRLIDRVPQWLLSGVTVAFILWLTLAPHPTGDLKLPLFPGADKIVHAVMFGFLAFIILLEMTKHRKWQPLSLVSIAVVAFACALFGIGIEFAQRAMGMGRSLEILDMMADSAGAMVAAGIWAALQNFFASS